MIFKEGASYRNSRGDAEGVWKKMTDTVTREFNERERAVFERHLAMERPPREPKGPWLGCLIMSIALGGLAYFFRGTAAGAVLLVFCLAGLLIVALLSMENVRWRKERLDVEFRLIEALEENRVEAARFRASEVVVEIDEYATKVYYFAIGESRILRVEIGSEKWPAEDPGDGHALYVEPGQDTWPNDRFEIVRTAKGGLWVGVFCLGEKLDPVRQINTIDEAPLVSGPGSPVALFAGSLEKPGEEPIERWT